MTSPWVDSRQDEVPPGHGEGRREAGPFAEAAVSGAVVRRYSGAVNTAQAFCPPNPKPLAIAALTSRSFFTFGV